jgi:CubicO group peptidase (beta-lactamase class C family)
MTLEAGASRVPDLSLLGQRVDNAIDRALAEQRVVGATMVVSHQGRILYRRCAGLADREAGRPLQPDSIFLLSSLTKPIVSAAALALVEQGRLTLDDRVGSWLPDFHPTLADGSPTEITVRHLLTHTAGLTYGLFQPADGPYRQAGVSDGLAEPGLAMDEQLRRLAGVPLSYAPGTAWGYSVALDVLGAILERAADASLPDIVRRLVTTPLGMVNTAFSVPDPDRLVTPYIGSAPPRRMADLEEVVAADGTAIRFAPGRIFVPDSFSAGGVGMAGTASDFLTFLEAVRTGGGPVLTPGSAQAMMTNQIGSLRINVEPTPSWGFGFGGAVLIDPRLAADPRPAGTWKWGGVYGHHWYVDRRNELSVVVLTNAALDGMTGRLPEDLLDAVYGPGPIAPGR